MTPRKASLRVAHAASCPNRTKTSLASLRGCKCSPSYYVSSRRRDGSVEKGERVKDRQVAERALRRKQVELDEDRVGVSRAKNVTFREWALGYPEILEQSGRKGSTLRAYEASVAYANAGFGDLFLREVGDAELRRMVAAIRKKGGDASVMKHLKHVSAMFARAVRDKAVRLDENPVPAFRAGLQLRVAAGVPPFSDLELGRLWAVLETLETDPVYMTFCKAAVVTGARAGELAGANLDDVDLLAGTFRIERHYDRESGTFTLPKDNESRVIHLIGPAQALLEAWVGEHGDRPGDAPLFEAPRGGRVNTQWLAKLVAEAMEKARPPIPKVGKVRGVERPRKPLHSLRSSFGRLMREQGADPDWLRGELGHSTLELSHGVYGEWSEGARKAEAAKVETLGFPV